MVLLYKYTNIQIYKYTNIQIYKYTNIQIYKYHFLIISLNAIFVNTLKKFFSFKNYLEILAVITRATPEVIQRKGILLFWIASLPFAMTMHFLVITRLFIAEVIHFILIATPTSRLAMTRWFTFNLISFRDFSLLFIKKYLI